MSQYLSFELINKENPEVKVDLGYWCTSIARGISYNFDGAFRYTGDEDVELDKDTLKSYIESVHNGVEEYKEDLRKARESKKENTELLLKAQTQVAVDAIKEDINIDEDCINDWMEEIDTWSRVENRLNYILTILEENEESWVLKYNNS